MRHMTFLAVAMAVGIFSLPFVGTAVAATAYEASKAYEAGEYETARSIAYPLAMGGDSDAEFLMGRMLEEGRARKPNLLEAFRWHRRAAERGHTGAQIYLAVGYNSGRGVAINYKEATRWWRVLALKGNATAQDQLARQYALGRGVPKNNISAYTWFSIAGAQGDEDAIKTLELLEKTMSRQDIVIAQAAAERCLDSRYLHCG